MAAGLVEMSLVWLGAGGRIGISSGHSEVVPCRHDAVLKVHAEVGGDAGVSPNGRVEPHLHGSSLILYVLFTNG